MSLKQYLVSTYGECARQQVVALEKSMCKLAKAKNYLISMQRLKENNIIPYSLRTACPVRTGLGREITDRYHKRLLHTRITDLLNKKRFLPISIDTKKLDSHKPCQMTITTEYAQFYIKEQNIFFPRPGKDIAKNSLNT